MLEGERTLYLIRTPPVPTQGPHVLGEIFYVVPYPKYIDGIDYDATIDGRLISLLGSLEA